MGNITFTASVNLTEYKSVFFDYDFGDGHNISGTKKNQTNHYYHREGRYNYSVHALVVLKEGSEAVHTSNEASFNVYGKWHICCDTLVMETGKICPL